LAAVAVKSRIFKKTGRARMKLEHTPGLTFALRRAMLFAERDGHREIAPAHLLLGLLADADSTCAAMLARAGLDYPAWQARFLTEASPTAGEDHEIRLTRSVRHILNLAREQTSAIGEEGSLATDQVLLALLGDAEDLCRELAAHGLDYQALLRQTAGEAPPLLFDQPLLFEDPREPIDVARIVDAAANRAREALRVLEDHSRFVLGDAFLSGRLKQLRHDLAGALAELPPGLLLAGRDTVHDVGTSISTAAEQRRASLGDVVRANARRLQEALRSLEEYGKVLSPKLGQAAEQLRYQAYTLERALLVGTDARQRLADARLYVLVTESLCRASLVGTIREAVEGGADVIQLREKDRDDRSLLGLAREVRRLTRQLGVLFIMNDRPDLALLAEADGVHLGQDDLPLQEARRLLGPEALIGISTHDLSQVRRAILEGASYLGVGPTFPSPTKSFDAFPGLDFVRAAMAETSLPAFALGGVTVENAASVVAAGCRRVAVSHAICAAEDPRGAARALKRALSAS
jgi:thiamine-phosphate pyrophosphorylase